MSTKRPRDEVCCTSELKLSSRLLLKRDVQKLGTVQKRVRGMGPWLENLSFPE